MILLRKPFSYPTAKGPAFMLFMSWEFRSGVRRMRYQEVPSAPSPCIARPVTARVKIRKISYRAQINSWYSCFCQGGRCKKTQARIDCMVPELKIVIITLKYFTNDCNPGD